MHFSSMSDYQAPPRPTFDHPATPPDSHDLTSALRRSNPLDHNKMLLRLRGLFRAFYGMPFAKWRS
jgi:hypothetical protein